MKNKLLPKKLGGKIADYSYLKKGIRYWNIWIGNPFSIGLYKVPLTEPKEEIIEKIKLIQKEAKENWQNKFPEIEWKD